MQPIKPNPQDGSGYPRLHKPVLCRWINTADRELDAYMLLSWSGEYWYNMHEQTTETPDEWVWVESAFETYNDN